MSTDTTPMPPDIASQIPDLVDQKLAQLPRQVSELSRRGWDREDLAAECYYLICRRWGTPRSGWDPDRGDLATWVYLVSRSRLGHLLDRTPQPTTHPGQDAPLDAHGRPRELPDVGWGHRSDDPAWTPARTLRARAARARARGEEGEAPEVVEVVEAPERRKQDVIRRRRGKARGPRPMPSDLRFLLDMLQG